jgi:hypothetical protein
MISIIPAKKYVGSRTSSSSIRADDSSGCKNGEAAFFSSSPASSDAVESVESFEACPFLNPIVKEYQRSQEKEM